MPIIGKHLRSILEDLPPQSPNARISLLIGLNCPKALEPAGILASDKGGPFAINTFARWVIMGSLYMSSTKHPVVSCCRVAAKEVGSGKHHGHHFMVETKVREMVTPQTLNKMFELDFTEQMDDKEQEYSQKDKRFLKIVCQGTQHLEDLLYEIPLPLHSDDPWSPDNREQVLQRAHWLRKSLIKSEKFYADYGFAQKVLSHLMNAKTGQVWYIPHHGFYHAKKPNKIRWHSTAAPDLKANH